MTTETQTTSKEFQTGGVAVVSTAHAVHDTYTGFLPALLPVLIDTFSLTNTAAGLLSLFMQLPSLLQPVFGRLADRNNLKILVVLAPTLTGAAMSLLGIAPSYGFLIFLLVLAGLSSASLHAVGPALGGRFAGNKLGRGMSFWMVGGELGRALGPLVIVTAIGALGAAGLPWLMLTGLLTSIFLFWKLHPVSTQLQITPKAGIDWKEALKGMRKVMLPLAFIIFTRALMMTAITTFLPTFLTATGSSLLMAGASLTILQVAGMVGAFLAGGLSDRFGRRRILVISFLASPILLFLFVQSEGALQIPLLILLGFFAISVVPVIMAVVLENFPENRSFANGIYMSMSFLIRALVVLLVGFLADLVDLRFTFLISAGLLPFGLIFVRLLPDSPRRIGEAETTSG